MGDMEIVRTNLDKDHIILRIIWALFCLPIVGYNRDGNIVFTGTNITAVFVCGIMIFVATMVIGPGAR